MKSTIGNILSQSPDRLLTDREERELTRRADAGDRKAKKELAKHNHRLVASIAKDYTDMGVPFEDLLMAGFEGLLKGIDKFDPERGNKLSTYVTWWIRQAVLRELDRQSSTIRIPGYVRDLKRQVNRLEEEREEEFSPSEISEEFGVSKKVAHSVKQVCFTSSLDYRFPQDNEGSLKELVENRKAKNPPQATSREKSSEKLLAAMEEKLTDRERRILKLRFGVEDYKPRTLNEVGVVFGLSRERIRQLQNRALKKLKNSELTKEAAQNI